MTTTMMKIEALAKVNFTLEVFAKRVDGYHALRSVVVPVSLADTLTIEPTRDGAVTSDTGYDDDLCVKAARVLRRLHPGPAGARIRVEKRIPAGGGLGGGSADAAAVLRALNDLWNCGLVDTELAALGSQVGSDVPALVLAQTWRAPVLMEGRGEVVSPFVPAGGRVTRELPLVLVNPGVFSSTPEVFRASEPRAAADATLLVRLRAALVADDRAAVAAAFQNDLEAPACRLHPEIAAAKAALAAAGATGVLMSGSGATVFGLVTDESAARALADRLTAQGWRAWPVTAYV